MVLVQNEIWGCLAEFVKPKGDGPMLAFDPVSLDLECPLCNTPTARWILDGDESDGQILSCMMDTLNSGALDPA